MIIPAVVGALGMIKQNIDIHIKKIPKTLSLSEMQKLVLMIMGHLEKLFQSNMLNDFQRKAFVCFRSHGNAW